MSRARQLIDLVWLPLPVWRRLDAIVLLVAVYTTGVEYVTQSPAISLTMPKWIGDMAVVNGLILGVLLSFRNTQAYDRWWEARKLWGQLINDCRNLCLKAVALADPDPDDRRHFGRLVAGFAVGLKNHLRGPAGGCGTSRGSRRRRPTRTTSRPTWPAGCSPPCGTGGGPAG